MIDLDEPSITKKSKVDHQSNILFSISLKSLFCSDIPEEIYPGSNLNDLKGYEGWNIDSSFEQIIKKKEKQRKRKK
jgi:hypothetical protein